MSVRGLASAAVGEMADAASMAGDFTQRPNRAAVAIGDTHLGLDGGQGGGQTQPALRPGFRSRTDSSGTATVEVVHLGPQITFWIGGLIKLAIEQSGPELQAVDRAGSLQGLQAVTTLDADTAARLRPLGDLNDLAAPAFERDRVVQALLKTGGRLVGA